MTHFHRHHPAVWHTEAKIMRFEGEEHCPFDGLHYVISADVNRMGDTAFILEQVYNFTLDENDELNFKIKSWRYIFPHAENTDGFLTQESEEIDQYIQKVTRGQKSFYSFNPEYEAKRIINRKTNMTRKEFVKVLRACIREHYPVAYWLAVKLKLAAPQDNAPEYVILSNRIRIDDRGFMKA